MNFVAVIIYGYILTVCLLVYFIVRDLKIKGLFFNKNKILSYFIVAVLVFGIFIALYSHFVEPFILLTKTVEIKGAHIKQPLKIAFVSDIQVGNHKKEAWVEKIVEKIISQNPDLVILGGDLIDNEGNTQDETQHLEPLQKITKKYPTFYVLGNHEYGLGTPDLGKSNLGTGNRSELLIKRMKNINAVFLKNNLVCLNIAQQDLCLFGIDDIWGGKPNFSELKNLPSETPLIFITHNPDGMLSYPDIFRKPMLVLAGHTHGGQVNVPFINFYGNADIVLPKKFYRGLNYWQNIPIYTSIGTGESGGQIRLLAIPEIVILNLAP